MHQVMLTDASALAQLASKQKMMIFKFNLTEFMLIWRQLVLLMSDFVYNAVTCW